LNVSLCGVAATGAARLPSAFQFYSSVNTGERPNQMRLAAFIRANPKPIIAEWENFARSLVPAAEGMSPLSLRNHINYILDFIADDIDSSQTETEQITKSRGEKPKGAVNSVAEIHAALRQAGGFNMDQMVSEYRALRATVTKLWVAQLSEATNQGIEDLIRFNESIDQTLTESISFYSKKLEHSRHLFLGILGHDLRNPIGAMLMSAQLTAKIGALNEHQKMLISQVVVSADRATSILDQLLDLTRARLGSGMQIIREPMDMAFASRQLVDEMRALHPGRTFSLDISGDTGGEWDKPRIGQVLSNLISNAVQYGFKDQPIGVTIKGGLKDVQVSVHNDGVPIPRDTIRVIFDSLIRGPSDEGESTNLGLGLYITKEIVSAHGGTVGVTSSEKNGTTFTARLPRSPGAAISDQDEAAAALSA
jgi:signal transduction histidine kinase